MRYMADAARYTANYTQHSRYTTRNTTRYTTRNTTEMLPGAAFQARTEKLTCIFISLLESLKALKCCPCQHFGSVACSVACSVAWDCHATLGHFHRLRKGFCFLSPLASEAIFRNARATLPSLCCNMVKPKCARLFDFLYDL